MPSLPKIRKSTFDTKRQKVVTYVQGGRITIEVDNTGLICVKVQPWQTYNSSHINVQDHNHYMIHAGLLIERKPIFLRLK